MQMALIYHRSQRADNVRLKNKIHGQVWVIPFTQNSHADKVCLLRLDLFVGIIPALLAKLRRRHFVARLTHLFLYIKLDREAVAVPPRDIRRIKPRQGFRFNDDVFQNLVDGVAHMKFAIGIRGAVMKNKGWLTLAHLPHLPIKVHCLPRFQPIGLALRQVRLHGKICLGQIQRTFVITHTLSVVPQPLAGVRLVRRNTRLQGIQ